MISLDTMNEDSLNDSEDLILNSSQESCQTDLVSILLARITQPTSSSSADSTYSFPPRPLEPYPPPYELPSGFSNQLPNGYVDPIKKC